MGNERCWSSCGRRVLLLLLLLCNGLLLVSSLACGSCPALFQIACCILTPPNCCAFKPGFCPAPTPTIPPAGIIATLCSGDNACSGAFKCCAILQNSTGLLYNVCTQPALTSNATGAAVFFG